MEKKGFEMQYYIDINPLPQGPLAPPLYPTALGRIGPSNKDDI
jgi:hypothetical protein